MKALVKAKAEPGIWMQDQPRPTCADDEVMIKIHHTAICGTDIHIYKWDEWAQKTVPVPLIIGHEFVGEIVECGRSVKGYRVGQIVSGEGHITCGTCRSCRAGARHLCRNTEGIGYDRTGAFAEYMCLHASNVFAMPTDIPAYLGAIFDPLGNAVHTALSFDVVGEDVLITGAGPIGIMAAAIVKHCGARHVVLTDVNDYRLGLMAQLDKRVVTVNVTQMNLSDVMQDLSMTEGFDVGLEMSGNSQAFNDLINYLKHGSKAAILGIPPSNTTIDWSQFIFKSLWMKGVYGREIFETWYKMTSMLQSGLNIAPIVTHQFAIDDYQEAFELMASGQSGKIILNW